MENQDLEALLKRMGNGQQTSELSQPTIQQLIDEKLTKTERNMKKQMLQEIGIICMCLAVLVGARFLYSSRLDQNKRPALDLILLLAGLYFLSCLWIFIRLLKLPNSINKDSQVNTYLDKLRFSLEQSLKWYLWLSNGCILAIILIAVFGIFHYNNLTNFLILFASLVFIPLNKWYIVKRFGSTIKLLKQVSF